MLQLEAGGSSTSLKLGTPKRVKKMDGDDRGVMAQRTYITSFLHDSTEPVYTFYSQYVFKIKFYKEES